MIVTLAACLTGQDSVDVRCRAGATTSDALAAAGLAPREVWSGEQPVPMDTPIADARIGHAAVLTRAPHANAWAGEAPRLVTVAGPDAGRSIRLTGSDVIGAGIPGLRDPAVDASHARVSLSRGSARIVDLGSVNGLARWGPSGRGRTTRTLRLGPGDQAVVGRSVVEFQAVSRGTLSRGRVAARIAKKIARRALSDRMAPGPAPLAGPDPTAEISARPHLVEQERAWWRRDAVVTGPHAQEAWRAITLARGVAPPPEDLASLATPESWLAWLAPDVAQRCGRLTVSQSTPTATTREGARSDGPLVVTARASGWEVVIDGETHHLPPCHVAPDAAEAIARRLAAATATVDPSPRWADLAALTGHTSAPRACVGIWVDDGSVWPLPATGGWSMLTVGLHGARRAAPLATIAAATAWEEPPARSPMYLAGDLARGPLAPLTDLPHVARAAPIESAAEVLAAALAAARAGERPLVIVDHAQALSRDGATTLDSLLALANAGAGPRVAVAATRASGVFSPAALAGAESLIAVADAPAQLAEDLLGFAPEGRSSVAGAVWVRRAGVVREARIAEPISTPTPLAWLGRGEPPSGQDLCAAAAARWGG